MPRANFNVLPSPEVPCWFFQKRIVRIVAAFAAAAFAILANHNLHDKFYKFTHLQSWSYALISAACMTAPVWLQIFPAWKDPAYQKERRKYVGGAIATFMPYKDLLKYYKREWESGIFTKDDLQKQFLIQINDFGFKWWLKNHTLEAVQVWDDHHPFPPFFWDKFREYVQQNNLSAATIKKDFVPIWSTIPGISDPEIEVDVERVLENFLVRLRPYS